jgi:hypothetical protein
MRGLDQLDRRIELRPLHRVTQLLLCFAAS